MPKNNTSIDVVKQIDYFVDSLSVKKDETILDLGCGTGDEIKEICKRFKIKKIYGLDVLEKLLAKARESLKKEIKEGLVEIINADVSEKLPFENNSFDLVYSAGLFECLPDEKKALVLNEIYRILKPGGRIVSEHPDWDTQTWNATDKNLERKLVHAFCDTTQEWMEASEGWMGRKLWGLINSSGLFQNLTTDVYVLTNTEYKKPFYGFERSLDLAEAIDNKEYDISQSDIDEFLKDLRNLNAKNEYFYSINRYIVTGYK